MKDNRILVVLIVIAIGIWANFLVVLFQPLPVRADDDIQRVDISRIGSTPVYYGSGLPVYIKDPAVVVDWDTIPPTRAVLVDEWEN